MSIIKTSAEVWAEREGFEPPDPCGSTVFKTAAIDHSAISPGAKVQTISDIPNVKFGLQYPVNRE